MLSSATACAMAAPSSWVFEPPKNSLNMPGRWVITPRIGITAMLRGAAGRAVPPRAACGCQRPELGPPVPW